MDKDLKRLMDEWQISDAEEFKDDFENFGEDKVSSDSVERILSSTLQKAGFEQQSSVPEPKGVITMNRMNADNKIDSVKEFGKVSNFRRGSVIAACLAIVAASTFTVKMLVGGNIGADEDNNSRIQVAQTTKTKTPVPADSGVTDEESDSDEAEFISETDSLTENDSISETESKIEKKETNSSVKTDTTADSKLVNETIEEEDRGGHAQAGNDYVKEENSDEIDRGGHMHAVNYPDVYGFDEDNYVDDSLKADIDSATIICEGTVTSKAIYGRSRNDDFKPLSDYSESELDNVGRLYFRCTVKLDGTCFKGQEYIRYLSQTRNYDPASGDMIVVIPAGRKITSDDDEFAPTYASTESEIDNADLFNVGEKLIVEYVMQEYDNSWNISGEDIYRYEQESYMYHRTSFYVPALRDENMGYESMTNYLLNTFKGGSVEAAEKWISYLGESSTIKCIPSKRFAPGKVVSVNPSYAENGFIIYVAE
ncbi:hypothetical protein [Ruminococcus albus]|nr:hypothetical protein [Ruminococcus albus]